MQHFAIESRTVGLSPCFAQSTARILAMAAARRAKWTCPSARRSAGRVLRARDVVVCNVLPGASRRVRAPREIGELARDCGRAPRLGAALAKIGGESESERPHAVFRRTGCPRGTRPVKDMVDRACGRRRITFASYGPAAITASS